MRTGKIHDDLHKVVVQLDLMEGDVNHYNQKRSAATLNNVYSGMLSLTRFPSLEIL